jgi:hypothetical protein
MVVHSESEQVQCVCPLLPAHQFPKLDTKYCQKILCPNNGDATLIEHETL